MYISCLKSFCKISLLRSIFDDLDDIVLTHLLDSLANTITPIKIKAIRIIFIAAN